MINLLQAGFGRVRKSKIFYLLLLFNIALALYMCYANYQDMIASGELVEVGQLMLNYITIFGIVIAIFTSLFLGVEYSDNTIRNKIGVGHTRKDIYLSNLVITTMTSLFSYVVFIIVIAAVGIPLFDTTQMKLTELLALLGCVFIAVVAYSAIFTLIAMAISNKAVIAIVSVLLAFGLLAGAATCQAVLKMQEVETVYSMEDGKIVSNEVHNPYYPSENKRRIYKALYDVNPAGQMYQLVGRSVPNLKVLPLYALGVFAVSTAAGIVLFKKKDLK